MHYCPYCSEPISAGAKSCPHCKRSLEIELMQQLYQGNLESSHIDPRIKRKMWFRERRILFYPLIALIVGLVAGAIISYGYAQIGFSSEREEHAATVEKLQAEIDGLKQAQGSAQSGFEAQLAEKDALIDLLTKERDAMGRVIYFTRRMARNSTITPNSEAEVTRFKNNLSYLQRLFDGYQETLKTKNFGGYKEFNLKTLPMFLE